MHIAKVRLLWNVYAVMSNFSSMSVMSVSDGHATSCSPNFSSDLQT